MDIVITSMQQPMATIVAIAGEIDIHNASELDAALMQVVRDESGDVVLDLAETTFLDSTALGVLVGVEKQLPSTRTFKLVCPNPKLLKIFTISRLDSVWPVFRSLADALPASPESI